MKWISVRDRLPERHTDVLIFDRYGTGCATLLSGDEWYECSCSKPEDVTHWMPLPEPPSEQS